MSPVVNNSFPTDTASLHQRIASIDPRAYAASRNYLNGAVTRLSPYVSRGLISTKQIMIHLSEKKYRFEETENLLKELAWRDYFQRVWQHKNIDEDILQKQPDVISQGVPESLLAANTGIHALDNGIKELYETGYMHNHLRMYVAAYACNHLGCHWHAPAQWMYHHLIDGDWASNACSWQWVAGANSKKKYFANQENINRYTGSTQSATFLDVSYEYLPEAKPAGSKPICLPFTSQTPLPDVQAPSLNPLLDTVVYTPYNLDSNWRNNQPANRVLILEPKVLDRYPLSQKVIDFILSLRHTIPDIKIFVGSFESLKSVCKGNIFFKEHPLCKHFTGICDEREWMCEEIDGYYPSFFGYWKKIEPHIKKHFS
ncbi:MAG: FAD-binding domain-containing protein [Bacteroidota bacterium]|jgi:deoxyribodipyrimidine photo-lyase